jgi:hypothetical protein
MRKIERSTLFGCSDWREAAELQDSLRRKVFIHDLYMKQLTSNACIDYVRSFEMMNGGNRTDYFLFFGTKNLEGLKKMKAAMWKADEAGGFQFSDTTDVTQALLFQPTPNYDDLKERLVRNFKGKKVSVDELEKFVIVETPYRETHYKMDECLTTYGVVESSRIARGEPSRQKSSGDVSLWNHY